MKPRKPLPRSTKPIARSKPLPRPTKKIKARKTDKSKRRFANLRDEAAFQHHIGVRSFEARFHLDLSAIADRLDAQYREAVA